MTYAVHNIHTPPVKAGSDRDIKLPEPLGTFPTLAEALTYQADKRALLPVYTHGVRP